MIGVLLVIYPNATSKLSHHVTIWILRFVTTVSRYENDCNIFIDLLVVSSFELQQLCYLLIATIIRIAGRPKAKGKHDSSPKQWMSWRRIGDTNVEMRDPELTAK